MTFGAAAGSSVCNLLEHRSNENLSEATTRSGYSATRASDRRDVRHFTNNARSGEKV
jgi:hypothetical protein